MSEENKEILNKRFTDCGNFIAINCPFEGLQEFHVRKEHLLGFWVYDRPCSYFEYQQEVGGTDADSYEEWLLTTEEDEVEAFKDEKILSIRIYLTDSAEGKFNELAPRGEWIFRYVKSEDYKEYLDDIKTLLNL